MNEPDRREKKSMPKNVIESKTKESLLKIFLLKNDEMQNVEVQKSTKWTLKK